MTKMMEQMKSLLADEFYDSAEIIGTFLLSNTNESISEIRKSPLACAHQVEVLSVYADAVYGKQEFQRAIQYYTQAIHYHKLASGKSDGNTSLLIGKMKYKLAKCLWKSKDIKGSMIMLESIPIEQRTLPIYRLLASIYKERKLKRKAEECYLNILAINPYALEAGIELKQLLEQQELDGRHRRVVVTKSFADIYQQYLDDDTCPALNGEPNNQQQHSIASVDVQDKDILSKLMRAYAAQGDYNMEETQANWESLLQLYPQNLHALLGMAECLSERGQFAQAQIHFMKALRLDAHVIEKMDLYAQTLIKATKIKELKTHVFHMYKVSLQSVETWLCATFLDAVQSDRVRALKFCDKAIAINPGAQRPYAMRGHLLLNLNRPEQAITAFTTSNQRRKTMSAYKGLNQAYRKIGFHRTFKEALARAKEALAFLPHKAEAHDLLGRLLLTEGQFDKARECFLSALELSPAEVAPNIGLSEIDTRKGQFQAAEDRLKDLLRQHPKNGMIHTKLGSLFVNRQLWAKGFEHFHIALGIDANNAIAQDYIAKLETLMRDKQSDPAAEEAAEGTLPNDPEEDFHGVIATYEHELGGQTGAGTNGSGRF